ncbi:MAG: serine/threonine protein kinase [Sandaracinus sp.]|nr:serine/threonine protein kinase [Sandaracinus sp.]
MTSASTPLATPEDDADPVTPTIELPRSGGLTLDSLSSASALDSSETLLDARPAVLDEPEERYTGRGVLGEGGMGEVRLYRDATIGRDVAMKVLLPGRAADPSARARFLREAIIQGQLEHPSIVPVHEIGETASGDPYFTMKRIRGVTLQELLTRLRRAAGLGSHTGLERVEDLDELEAKYSQRHLLNAFAQACLAVDFAHSRGVVHRDLKPSNIMLGDFGEVYVLDWGIARVMGSDEGGLLDSKIIPPVGTRAGTVLGTPGYIAPEQVKGSAAVDGRADIYSLGAMLFEILTLKALHRVDRPHIMLTETLAGADPAARARRSPRKVDPELMSICVQATRLDASERFQTARELHEAIRRYLEGHQHLERRKRMAEVHAKAAHEAKTRALQGGMEAVKWHRWAMREAGLALALDPQHAGALDTVLDLLVRPPKTLPPEARKALQRSRRKLGRFGVRALALARFSWALYLPVVFWMGVRSPGLAVLIFALAFSAGFFQYWVVSQGNPSVSLVRVASVVNILSIAPLTFAFGPYGLTPLVVVASLPASILYLDGLGRRLAGAPAVVAILGPGIAEWLGWLPPMYAVEGGILHVLPQAVHFDAVGVRVFLAVISIAAVFTSVRMVAGVRDYLQKTEELLHRQAWQLRQLVPRPSDEDERSITTSITVPPKR